MSTFESYPIPPKQRDDIVLVGGGVNPELTASIAKSVHLDVTPAEYKRHANGELYVRIEESVRGKDVYIVQSHATANGYSVEEAVNEHLYLTSAAAGSSAKSVTSIAPYLIHSRGDRKSKGREVVPAPLIIQFYEAAGADSLLSIDLHAKQTAEHFRGPGAHEHLTAQPELRHAVIEQIGIEAVKNCVVVAPDAGAVKNNKRHAEELSINEDTDIEVIFMGKERARSDSTNLKRDDKEIAGVEGKICLTFDDMIDGGGTMVTAAKALKNSGAKEVYVAATHAIFSGNATEKLMKSKIDKVFVTDTLPVKKAKAAMKEKLQIVRIGPLIGRAIYEIVTDGSISSIHDEQNYH